MNQVSRGISTSALVIAADVPPQGATRLSNVGKCTIRVLAEGESGPIPAARSGHLKKDQWLVRGMEIPVEIDPGEPDDFEVDWDAIAPIEDRAAANDPCLADPIGAARRVSEAMRGAGLAGPSPEDLPEVIGGALQREREASASAAPDRFAEAMETAAREQAPSGKERAVVLVSTIRPRLYQSGSGSSGPSGPSKRTTEGKCNAVLAVNVPGRDPYAVYEKKFNSPKWKGDITGAGLPALVSSGDATEVEILWDELPSLESQIGQRISDQLGAAEAGMKASGEMEGQMADAIQQAASGAPPAGAGMGGLNPQMKEMLAQNARMALSMTKDPAQRKLIIDQYKMAGVEIDEADLD